MNWQGFIPASWTVSAWWPTAISILWLINWLGFWVMLAWLMKDPMPRTVFAGSVVLAGVVGYVLSNGDANHKELLVRFLVRAVKEIYPIVHIGMRVSFIPLIFANALLGLALKFRWGVTDPIRSGLQKVVRWPTRVKHAKYAKRASKKRLTYLGFEASRRQPVFLEDEERNKHIQVVGSTGSGKTRFSLFPLMRQDIEAGRGVIFIDAKGSSENAKIIWKIVNDAGRAKDFLFFSLTDHKHSSTYNPLKHGNPSQLKDKIAASIDWSEPFYQRICESALQTLFMDVERLKKRIALPELLRILKSPPSGYPNFFEQATKHTDHIQTLESEVGLLIDSPFGGLLEESSGGIDLLDVYMNNKIAYFALDTQSYQHTAARLGKMITQDLNTISGLIESELSDKEKRPLAVFIDEFQAFGTRGFINALARGRSSGFWITIAHQSLGDLKAIDDAYLQQVFENTNTKIFLKVNDPETAQMFADSVGTRKVVETTSQVLLAGTDPKNIMGSNRIVYEYLIHPSELKTLTTGRAVFKSRGGCGHLCLPGVFFSTEGIELPEKRPSQSIAAPVRAAPQTARRRNPPKEEPIII